MECTDKELNKKFPKSDTLLMMTTISQHPFKVRQQLHLTIHSCQIL